ncbi:RT0821/Lpp0805 family surface protein [Sulfitobacter sp. R18_1]|uniref:RT0821/Lpp0805 family surface protein n=1 Tax=Sulfitobacter sp. R18_1 TaxID=2821104 RepID=UPI001ADC2536|nr:RT0821/Lpp0805 family surface protein [Sulfitobacter sp. R18_1]MBO9428406.1 hypothetical protein [Sulfitobacter sp. R18_1]
MKTLLATSILVLAAACTINTAPVGDISPVYLPEQPTASPPAVKVPTAIMPAIEIDEEPNKARYYKGSGIGGDVAEYIFKNAKIVFAKSDYEHIEKAANAAISSRSTGDVVRWANRSTKREGHVKVTKALNKDGRYCRELETEILMNGGKIIVDNTVCKNKGGGWFLQD